jgi:hypothetical protein
MEENIKEKMNKEEYQKETQDWINISDKKSNVLFDNKLIGVFCEAINKFGFEKTWDIFMKLQNYLKYDIYKSVISQEIKEADLKKVVDLINKEFDDKHGYSKKDLLKSIKRLQVKLIEEYEKLNSEKLKNCIEKK